MNLNQFILEINIIAILIASSTLSFGVYQYLKNKDSKVKQILRLIYAQLEIFGAWVGTEGRGYGKELTNEEKFDNANPFKLIYEIENNQFIQITLLDELNFVPKDILGKINEFNQNIVRITNIQNFRNQIVVSDIDLSWQIKELLDNYNKQNRNFEVFLQSIKDGKKVPKNKEKFNKHKALRLIDRLIYYGTKIHCDIIGDSKSNGMKEQLEIIKEWTEKELKERNKKSANSLSLFVFITALSWLYLLSILLTKGDITGLLIPFWIIVIILVVSTIFAVVFNCFNKQQCPNRHGL